MERDVFLKICNFCVYQERSQEEIRQKLATWNISGDEAEEIISELITENFLNEERFAKQYAGGKFRVKKWGRLKIRSELKRKSITDKCIQIALKEIDEEDYFLVLQALLFKKMHALKTEQNLFLRKSKAASYALQKGFESHLIREVLNNWVEV